MRNRSKKVLVGNFAPIKLPAAFPVSRLSAGTRSDVPPIAPHIHNCFEIGYCYEGSGIFMVDSKIMTFCAGDAVVINHHEMHVMSASRGGETRWGFLNLDPAKLLAGFASGVEPYLDVNPFSGEGYQNIVEGELHPDLSKTIFGIVEEIRHKPKGFRSRVRALVWSMMVLLYRINPDLPAKRLEKGDKEHQALMRIRPALQHMADSYSNEISLEELAGICSSSVSNLRKLFYAGVGCSPMSYLKQLRLKAAATMLRNTDLPVLDISLECGYATLSNFNRQFKEFYKVPPKQYRGLAG